MQIMYRKKEFIVYSFKDEYIVCNSKKAFKYHTHIKNYNTAKFLIDIVLKESIPRDLNIYLLESVARITANKEYSDKIRELIATKKKKSTKKYINVNKGVKRK